MKETEEILKKSGITPTPVRKLVYHCLKTGCIPMSLSDLEQRLDSVDKSTISRTLTVFKKHHLLHSLNDGSGSVKYEICHSSGDHHDDLHVHFRCLNCGETICINSVNIPHVDLPDGYQTEEISYIITGTCKECNKKAL